MAPRFSRFVFQIPISAKFVTKDYNRAFGKKTRKIDTHTHNCVCFLIKFNVKKKTFFDLCISKCNYVKIRYD